MLRQDLHHGHWRVTVWEESSRHGKASQDAALVSEVPEGLRVAVLDGCTPGISTPRWGPLDGASYATALLRTSLAQPQPIHAAAYRANEAMLTQFGHLSVRSRPQAAFVAVTLPWEVPPSENAGDPGLVEYVGAGDCEIWGRTGEKWTRIFGGPYVGPLLRDQLDELWTREANLEHVLEREEEIWQQAPSAEFLRPLVGTMKDPRLTSGEVSDWDCLVLASDGARLDPERLHDLDRWLMRLRTWEKQHAHDTAAVRAAKPSDDVTVMRIRKA